MIETFRKIRKAQSETDFETWGGTSVSGTLNIFENSSDIRATVLIVERKDDLRMALARPTDTED